MAVMTNPLSSCIVLVIAAGLALLSAPSIVHAQELIGVQLNDTLYCTPSGNQMNGSGGAAGVNVTLACGGLLMAETVASAETNNQGLFNITIPLEFDGPFPFSQGDCQVAAHLPAANSTCRNFPRFGSIVAPVVVKALRCNGGNVTAELGIVKPYRHTLTNI